MMIKRESSVWRRLQRDGEHDALYIGPSTDLEYIGAPDAHPDEGGRCLPSAKDGRCFAMTPLLYKGESANAFGDLPFYAEGNDHESFTEAFRRVKERRKEAGDRPAIMRKAEKTAAAGGRGRIGRRPYLYG